MITFSISLSNEQLRAGKTLLRDVTQTPRAFKRPFIQGIIPGKTCMLLLESETRPQGRGYTILGNKYGNNDESTL